VTTDSPAPPFFIIGNDRSGTTMLRVMLHRSPEAALPTESMFLGDFAPVRAGRIDLSRHDAATRFARIVWEHPKVKMWDLEGPAPVPPNGLSHADAYRFAVEAPYHAYAGKHGKALWGDKTPYYLDHIEEILAVWPDAKFLVMIRDGRDVALSIRELPFGANNVWAAASEWARGIRIGRWAEERYPDQVMSVRYEDLTADPERHLREICQFLGLTFSTDMLSIEKAPRDVVEQDKESWFTNLWSGINQKSVGKWRTKMTPHEQSVFATVAGEELEQCGYELGDHAEHLVLGTKALGYRAHNVGVRAVNFVKLRFVQERGRELRYVVKRKMQRL
jgi:hypothetical protein